MPWSEEFQRLVVAAMVRGDLLDRVPVDAGVFSSANDRGATTPRRRIVDGVLRYFEQYGARPTPEILAQLAADAAERLGPEERRAVEDEASAILSVDPPSDQSFVTDRVRVAMELQRMERALVQAADLLERGESALPAARELVLRAAAPIEQDDLRTVRYIADAEWRVARWADGDSYGEKISTGLPELDRAMSGGPTRRETHYFLAPPKGAKTAFQLRVARGAITRGFGVLLTTFEMQSIRMALRIDRAFARASKAELVADQSRLTAAIDMLRAIGAPELFIDERPPQRPNSVDETARRVDQIRKQGGRVDVVVLDYLNIMGAAKDEREKRHELPRISREMSALAKNEDVLVWSAALVNRKAVGKKVVRKTDIAEAFEVIAVADGCVAICATDAMVRAGLRRLYVAASREEADEVRAGDYRVDLDRQTIDGAAPGEIAGLPVDTDEEEDGE